MYMCDQTGRFLPIFLALLVTAVLTVDASGTRQADSQNSSAVDPETSHHPPSTQTDITLEQRVLSRLHQINRLEVRAGEMAVERGQSDWIRKYGDRLVRDHRSTDKKVLQLAEEEDIELVNNQLDEELPRKRMQSFQQMMTQLKTVEGREFDQLFLKMMIMSHRQTIDMLTTAVEDLQNENIRALVENVIPILNQHRKLARHIQADKVV